MDREIIEELSAGNTAAVLTTILETRGSTPRKAGTQMLVRPDGTCRGTIGGGRAEYDIRQQALEVMKTKKNTVGTVTLCDHEAMAEGMVCGGTMQVLFQYIQA